MSRLGPETTRVPSHRLGALPVPVEALERRFHMTSYLPVLPSAPAAYDASEGITTWPMYANDRLGDCTCAAAGHMVEPWTKQVDGSPRIFEDSDIIGLYGKVNGGQDQGADPQAVLDVWRKEGLAGDTILAYAAVDPQARSHVTVGLWLFTGLYIAIALPRSAQSQQVWDAAGGPDGEPGSWGGHMVNAVQYDDAGLTIITWGASKRMTWNFWEKYVELGYVVIPSDYQRLAGHALENGFNLDQLQQDLGGL